MKQQQNGCIIEQQFMTDKNFARNIQYIESETQGDCEIYYSMENNTLGEAALVVVEETGEENFRTFLSETRSMVMLKDIARLYNYTQSKNKCM